MQATGLATGWQSVGNAIPEHVGGEENWPPERGLPRLETTLNLRQLTDRLVATAIRGTAASIRYALAEGQDGAEAASPEGEAAEEADSYDLEDDAELENNPTLEVEE
jgi:hypothetical protein